MKWFGGKARAEEPEVSQAVAVGFDDFEVRLGDLMRGERATLGKSLLDVQRELHIRATYIAAIESGDLSAFEAASFVAGYVRSYARYLGMDPDWSYAKFCAETGFAISTDLQRGSSSTLPKTPASLHNNRDFSEGLLSRTRLADDPDPFWRRLDPVALGSVAVMVALVVGLGYGGWAVLQEVQRVNLAPADQPPAVMAELDPVIAGAAPRMATVEEPGLRIGGEGASFTANAQGVVRDYRPEALETPIVVSRDGPIAAINPRSDVQDDMGIRSAIEMALAEAEGGPFLGEEIRVTQDGPPLVEVLAVRPSWIRVRASDGTVLFEKVLNAGERYTVPQAETPATLRAGNSGSVYLLVNGQPFGPTAPGAQVVDQIALSADAVAERFELADLNDDQALREFIAVAEMSE
jgi:cytoskeletal protein RodZ